MRDVETCSLCPRLCRHACPVAVGTGREAATPTSIAGVLVDHARGLVSDDLARQASTLCVDCGACQDACHLHTPLPQRLREVRDALLAPGAKTAIPDVPSGDQALLLVPLATDAAAARALVPSATQVVVCPDRLGTDAHHGSQPVREDLQAAFAGRMLFTTDGGIFEVLTAAGLAPSWAVEVTAASVGSCVCSLGDRPPLACCGARGPLREHHPESARQLAQAFARRLKPGSQLLDTRCAQHMLSIGET